MFSKDDRITLQTLYWLVNFYEGKGMREKAQHVLSEIDRELDEKLAELRRRNLQHQAA